jgi:hypothetical protein
LSALTLVPSERGARFALTLPVASAPTVSLAGEMSINRSLSVR